MIGQLLAKVIGTQNEREIKRLRPAVAEIGALEPQIQALTDEQLRAKTDEFRKRFAEGVKQLHGLFLWFQYFLQAADRRATAWLATSPR